MPSGPWLTPVLQEAASQIDDGDSEELEVAVCPWWSMMPQLLFRSSTT